MDVYKDEDQDDLFEIDDISDSFAWWVNFTLKKQDKISSAVRTRMKKKTFK